MKRFLAFMLVLVMTLSLAACGGGNDAPAQDDAEPKTDASTDTPPVDETEPEPEPEPEQTAIPLQCGDQIDNDNFCMTFESVELLPEFSYSTSEYSSTSLYVEDGYQLVVVKGHFENKGTSAISESAFSLSALVNGNYETDVSLHFMRSKYFEIDAYTDIDYVLSINIPNKLAEMFETAAFTIGFNDDMSFPVTVWGSDGSKSVEVDQLYTLTSGTSAGGAAPAGDGGTPDDAAPAGESGIWSVNYYVDDFQQPTDEWYITTAQQFSGTFSNSATTNSNLLVQMAADQFEGETRIAFFLWEYGRNQVKNSSERNVDEYDITMRTPDGTDHNLTGTLYCGGDRIFIDDAYVDEVLTAMQGEGAVSFYVVQSDRTTTSYLFSIDTDNFASVYANQAG